ncbi:MAG: S8 family serine peptidase [Desulfobacteraceae bacterium]|nr:S8 family serine peptidase [Desulfobacteraceae bacterium]
MGNIEDKLDPYITLLLDMTPEERSRVELRKSLSVHQYPSGDFLVDLMIDYLGSDGDEYQGNIRLPLEQVPRLCDAERIRHIRIARFHRTELRDSVPFIKADQLHQRSGNGGPVKGRGAIVGIIDTGIDFMHPAFRNGNQSRILCIWDLNLEPEDARYETSPTIASHTRTRDLSDLVEETLQSGDTDLIEWNRIRSLIETVRGVEYTKEDIEYTIAEIQSHGNDRKYLPPPPLAAAVTPPNTPRFVRHRDMVGHGTHVAGIAAGNHTEFMGVAPEADIVVVVSDYTDTALYDGIQYIRGIAAAHNKPFVINYSMGSSSGPHDGSGADSRQINHLFNNNYKGQALVTSAGNSADEKTHVRARKGAGGNPGAVNPCVIDWILRKSNRYNDHIEIWYKGSDTFEVEVKWPAYPEAGINASGTTGRFNPESQPASIFDNRVKIFRTDTGAANLDNTIQVSYSQPSPYNGDKQLIVNVGSGTPFLYGLAVHPTAGKMYWIDLGLHKIQRSNLDGTGIEDLVSSNLKAPNGIALDTTHSKIYWIDGGAKKIQRADLNGANVQDLVTTGLNAPRGIDLDVAGGKIYWTDSGSQKIQRANLDGSNVEDIIASGLNAPKGIVLDKAGNKMYWTESGSHSIRRAGLDGAGIQTLVSQDLVNPKGIAIDKAGGKIYWIDSGTEKIQRADLDGTNVELLVPSALSYPKDIALDKAGGKMYWTESGAQTISRAGLNGDAIEELVRIPTKPIIPGTWQVCLNVQNYAAKANNEVLFDAWSWGGSAGRPEVNAVTPAVCSTQGWIDVEITGDNFVDQATSVAFVTTTFSSTALLGGGSWQVEDVRRQALTVKVINSKRLIATLPPVPADGEYDVYVTNSGIDTGVLYRGLRFENPGASGPAPTITNITPALQCGMLQQREFTITGTNFIANRTKVVFGNDPFGANTDNIIRDHFASARVTFVSATQIRAKVPVGPAGSVQIHVITPNGSAVHSAPLQMQTTGDAPSLLMATPNHGPVIGWERVTLDGGHFTADMRVFFGPREAKIVDTSGLPSQVVVISPPGPEKWVEIRPHSATESPGLNELTSPLNRLIRVYTAGGRAETTFGYDFNEDFWETDEAVFADAYYDQATQLDDTLIYTDEDNWITIGPEAAAKFTIAVAACKTGGTDQRVLFSSIGPRRAASTTSPDLLPGRPKPDIAAPGWFIASARSSFCLPAETNRDRLAEDSNGFTDPDFIKMPGTSMASPHVAGAVALVFSRKLITYSEILEALKESAEAHPGTLTGMNDELWRNLWGYGRLNAEEFFKEGTGEGCFIATAGYGSVLHPDVCFLRFVRDNILRKTRAGHQFFKDYWEHYYKFSPLIVDLMQRDAQVKEIIRWSVVTPLVNYLKLVMNRPSDIPPGTDPAIKAFLEALQRDMLKWLSEFKVPEQFDGMDNAAIADEIIVMLNYIVKEKRLEYLKRLVDKGGLPLKTHAEGEAEQLRARLENGGCTDNEIDLIL